MVYWLKYLFFLLTLPVQWQVLSSHFVVRYLHFSSWQSKFLAIPVNGMWASSYTVFQTWTWEHPPPRAPVHAQWPLEQLGEQDPAKEDNSASDCLDNRVACKFSSQMETKSIYSTQILFLSKIQQKSKFQILKITKSYLEGYYEEKIW